METYERLPDVYLERHWFVMWAPRGIGTTAHVESAQAVLREHDPYARVWYPLKEESIDGDLSMVPFYAGYLLVECIWTPAMEIVVQESLPIFIEFIKDYDTMLPVPIPEDQVKDAQDFIEADLRNPERLCKFNIGDQVRVLKKSLLGFVGPVLSTPTTDKVLVELPWFNRPTPTWIDVNDLELL